MAFELPEELPADLAGLDELRTAASAEVETLRSKVEAGEDLTDDEIRYLTGLADAIETLDAAYTAAETAEAERKQTVDSLLDRTKSAKPADAEDEAPADEAPEAVAAAATTAKAPSLAGVTKTKNLDTAKTVGFQMIPNVPNYRPGVVGFSEVAESMARQGRSGGIVRANKTGGVSSEIYDYKTGKLAAHEFSQQTAFATLDRGLTDDQIVKSVDEFEAKLAKAVDASNLRAAKYDADGALVAAAGWCAPSETVWDFCDVTEDNDLITIPELNIPRGGLRFPEEPDMTSFYASLPFFYTAAQLEAGVTKPCVEVPCVEFDEITKNATGICITVGLLQEKAWPELVKKYLAEVMKAHQHDQHSRTIAAMAAASGAAVVMPAASTLGVVASVLNSLDWNAADIRVRERMGRRARIEGVAPSWLLVLARSDLALREGRDFLNVSEQDVDNWLAARQIFIQWVSDWQARGAGQIGDPAGVPLTLPATVDVLLYPSGAFFRHVDNVIEVGNLYDKAQLQSNTKTALFTEDEFAVGKRCRTSRVVRVPLCVSGAIGAREFVTCNLTEAPGAA